MFWGYGFLNGVFGRRRVPLRLICNNEVYYVDSGKTSYKLVCA